MTNDDIIALLPKLKFLQKQHDDATWRFGEAERHLARCAAQVKQLDAELHILRDVTDIMDGVAVRAWTHEWTTLGGGTACTHYLQTATREITGDGPMPTRIAERHLVVVGGRTPRHLVVVGGRTPFAAPLWRLYFNGNLIGEFREDDTARFARAWVVRAQRPSDEEISMCIAKQLYAPYGAPADEERAFEAAYLAGDRALAADILAAVAYPDPRPSNPVEGVPDDVLRACERSPSDLSVSADVRVSHGDVQLAEPVGAEPIGTGSVDVADHGA